MHFFFEAKPKTQVTFPNFETKERAKYLERLPVAFQYFEGGRRGSWKLKNGTKTV